ncbi:MAG: amino acid permease [Candidatus Latescibacteria bacterium]|nr:amino acid permease [bacterium]MBD3424304.1 amino acid permease [Candidatus Latescibacterota bacterium]
MKLKKELNSIEVFSIAAGSMISSGLFVLPAVAYRVAGPGVIISYFIAGVLVLPALISQLELATAIPKAGGTYFFSERILGTPAGVVNGMANWFSISLKSALALVGIGAFASLILPDISEFQIKLVAGSACLVFTFLNIFSLKLSGRVQVIMVMFLLSILVGFVLVGYRFMDFEPYKGIAFRQWDRILVAAGMIFISYGGLTKIASVAEEIKNPKRVLVRSAFSAFIIVQALYLLVIFVIVGVLPPDVIGEGLTPVTNAALQFTVNPLASRVFLIITAGAAILAFITTANAGIMTASRVPLSMARDELIPQFFSREGGRRNTPVYSILFTALFMLLAIFAFNIEKLAKVASLFMLVLFMMVNLALIVIRYSRISNYRPSFRSPLFPFIQIAGILCYLFLIIRMGTFTITAALIFTAAALTWYFLYSRKRARRKSAFLNMVESVTAPEFRVDEKELEAELLDILIERDEIVLDRFDRIIQKAAIMDLNRPMTREEVFGKIAEVVAKRWGLKKESLEKKFQIREEEASTLVYPGVAVPHAIPHVVVEGEHLFDIVLVRNKAGITWNSEGETVKTVFALIGSSDERNFHLRALMYIAQILQDPDFHREWSNARDEKELRSVILLTKRRRG